MTLTWILSGIGWWLAGTSSMLWLSRGNDLTWGQLLVCALFGIFGPVLWAMIAFIVLCQADFWHEPIFKKSNKN